MHPAAEAGQFRRCFRYDKCALVVSADGIVQKVGLSFKHVDSRHAELAGMDISDSDLFTKVAARNKPVWSEVFTAAISAGPAIAYALPIEGTYLIGEMSLVKLGNYLKQLPSTDGSLFFITDNNGQNIAAKHGQAPSTRWQNT